MRVLFDTGHPAHVHLFKNLFRKLIARGHKCLMTARDKDVTIELMRDYRIDYALLGQHYERLHDKIYGLVRIGRRLVKTARRFDPDVILSHGSVYAALASALLRKPHISMEDTGNIEQILLYRPFTKVILTPSCFERNLGSKQIRFNGYHELAYLHPSTFGLNSMLAEKLNTRPNGDYILFRFVSWRATHDIGQMGIRLRERARIVNELSKYAEVMISSEDTLPEELHKYEIKYRAADFHTVMKCATIVISEGAKVAAEAAIMGVPSIYVNTRSTSYIDDLQYRYNIVMRMQNMNDLIDKVLSLMQQNDIKLKYREKLDILFREKIDVTQFLLWFVEEYPQSAQIMLSDPGFDAKFKSYDMNTLV